MHNISKMRKLLLVCWAMFFCSTTVLAAIDLSDLGVGARCLGQGKYYAAGIDDASAIFTNPAALAFSRGFKAVSMNGTLLSDVNYLLLGASDDSALGHFGIGFINASVSGIPITTVEGSGATRTIIHSGDTEYSNRVILFSYGTKLGRIFRGKGDHLLFGLNLKYFLQGFSGGGVVMNDAAGAGMDADLGLIWDVNPRTNLGLSVHNFLPADWGGRFIWQKNSVTESIPMTVRLGGDFQLNQQLNLGIDYDLSRQTGKPSLWHTGLEFSPIQILALRVGIDQKAKAETSGSIGTDNNMTAGVGLNFKGFTFDYAYSQFGEIANNATHFFSIGFREKREEDRGFSYVGQKRKGPTSVTVIPKPVIRSFKDVPNDYWARKPIEYLAALKIMSGYGDGTFRPDKVLTRGELAAILVKAKGFKVADYPPVDFLDLYPGVGFAPFISVAVQRGYMKGYADGTFRPKAIVTRAQAAEIFANYAGLYQKEKVSQNPFPDVSKTHWVAPALAASKSAGLFEYLGGKDFGPKELLTRAEAAEILSKVPFVKEEIKEMISGEN